MMHIFFICRNSGASQDKLSHVTSMVDLKSDGILFHTILGLLSIQPPCLPVSLTAFGLQFYVCIPYFLLFDFCMQRYNFFSIFPQLAVFYFLSWLNFVSSVGRISFPQLAVFRFLSWLYYHIKSPNRWCALAHQLLGDSLSAVVYTSAAMR